MLEQRELDITLASVADAVVASPPGTASLASEAQRRATLGGDVGIGFERAILITAASFEVDQKMSEGVKA
jgi:hypothetical protein